jgi:hypothetical protein
MSIIGNMWKTIGGGDVGGPVHDLWDNFTGAQQAHDANETSINLANTAVQRRKADLTAAGFNPLLAVGNPADSPGIRSAPSLGEGISRAVETYKTYGAAQLQKSQAANLNSAAAANAAKARKDNADAQTSEDFNAEGGGGKRASKIQAEIERMSHENNLSDAQASQAEAIVNEIAEKIKTAPYERAKLYQSAWFDMVHRQAMEMDVKARKVAYHVLVETAVSEIMREERNQRAIEGPAGTTGANLREASIGGGAGVAALIKSIFH